MLIIYNPGFLFIYNVIIAKKKKNGALNLYEQNVNFDFFYKTFHYYYTCIEFVLYYFKNTPPFQTEI